MGNRLVKQPNGLYGRFSEVVDDFTHLNLTKEQAIKVYVDDGAPVAIAIDKLQRADADDLAFDRSPSSDGLRRWRDSLGDIEIMHGAKRAAEVKKEVNDFKVPVRNTVVILNGITKTEEKAYESFIDLISTQKLEYDKRFTTNNQKPGEPFVAEGKLLTDNIHFRFESNHGPDVRNFVRAIISNKKKFGQCDMVKEDNTRRAKAKKWGPNKLRVIHKKCPECAKLIFVLKANTIKHTEPLRIVADAYAYVSPSAVESVMARFVGPDEKVIPYGTSFIGQNVFSYVQHKCQEKKS